MNDGDHETSGTSFKRLRTCLKQRNQPLTLRLQNLHITEYKGKRFQVFSTMQRFPCSGSQSHKKYRLAIVLYRSKSKSLNNLRFISLVLRANNFSNENK